MSGMVFYLHQLLIWSIGLSTVVNRVNLDTVVGSVRRGFLGNSFCLVGSGNGAAAAVSNYPRNHRLSYPSVHNSDCLKSLADPSMMELRMEVANDKKSSINTSSIPRFVRYDLLCGRYGHLVAHTSQEHASSDLASPFDWCPQWHQPA